MIKPIHFGKYILLDKIATGGMAEVFLAMAKGLGGFEKILVVKRILPHHTANKEFLKMFVNEARIALQLNQSNIIQIYDFGEENGHYYLAMEYVEGKNLRELLACLEEEGSKLPLEHVLFFMSEIAKGLDYAHRKKDDKTHALLHLVHRDVSPQNILISYEGEVKIIDFGIAQAVMLEDETSKVQVLKGKFAYMSPEQVEGTKLDCRSDIFSLGILLYETLTCQKLFAGENSFETLLKIKKCEVPLPSLYNPDIPEEVEGIVLKALQKDPEKRFQSAAEMQKALKIYLSKNYPEFTSHEFSSFLKKLFTHEVIEQKKKMKEIISFIEESTGNEEVRVQLPPHSAEIFIGGKKQSKLAPSEGTFSDFEKKVQDLDTYIGKKPVQEDIVSRKKETVGKRWNTSQKQYFMYVGALSIVVLALVFSLQYLFHMNPKRHLAGEKPPIHISNP
ncbi:MAG: serine/threonine protein kinase [Deltaproteobacteria bacterium]|nr:serine/threonine protein kinase [Deltaproteobacteria bacterium]